MSEAGNLMADAQVDTGGGADQGAENTQTDTTGVVDQTGDQTGDQTKGAAEQTEGASDQTGDQTKDGDQQEGSEADSEGEGAPETYERFALPEDIPYDEALAGEFQPIAKELNLSQKQADKLATFYGELEKRKMAEGQENFNNFTKELQKKAMDDPEIGGKVWESEARTCVAKARDLIGGEEFKTFLEQNPLIGNHPEMLRFAYRVGKVIGEGSFVDRRAGDSGKQSTADVMFADMVPKEK